ncbi:glycerophosphoryl diester phosphodiesterase membrane domain-containing protein [Salipaludibacillus daqingensis]|uniref:glycerophosphoryl diester phosphodiesterase membrane domain-containing protein n=1 Tax=Salipaludibacillus daqingensis TaxID=3041001 RepID=UPI0024751B50|nr:glycerophosphoryl diester phosphodiesterase membrane domain-containing protein [Salipaludibacillus daqingensis]
MLVIVKRSLQDFYLSYKKYVAFALIYMLMTSFLFVPVISFLFNRMLKAFGSGSLLNAEVYRIGLSTVGLIGLLIISFLTVVIFFIEFGVMIIIAQQTYFKRDVLVSEALVTTVKKLPALLGFGMIQLMVIFFMILPFIDSPVFPALLDFNIPIILTSQFYSMSTVAMILFLIMFLMAVFFLTRLIFTLHFIFIEQKSVWNAMKESWKFTKYKKVYIIVNVLLLNLVIFVSGFLIITILSYIPNVADTIFVSQIIENYLITFSSFMALIISLLFIPLNIIILTNLYYHFKNQQGRGESVKNKLIVYPSKRLAKVENGLTGFFAKRKYSLVAVIFIYVTTVFALNYTVNDQLVYLKWNVQVAAHRGDLQNAPENSLSSIESALEKGVDAIEIDVMLTSDGVIVLNHDPTLRRVADMPDRVEEMPYVEVAEVDIGSQFSEEFIGETIPTLDEALDLLQDEPVTVIIDIKLQDLTRSNEMAKSIVELVEKYEMEDNAYVQAFDYEPLQEVRKENSEIKIGIILYLVAGGLDSLDVDFYTIRQTMLTERFIETAKAQDREVWVWTVNLPRNIREVLKYDIDGIITDYPVRVQRMTGIEMVQD